MSWGFHHDRTLIQTTVDTTRCLQTWCLTSLLAGCDHAPCACCSEVLPLRSLLSCIPPPPSLKARICLWWTWMSLGYNHTTPQGWPIMGPPPRNFADWWACLWCHCCASDFLGHPYLFHPCPSVAVMWQTSLKLYCTPESKPLLSCLCGHKMSSFILREDLRLRALKMSAKENIWI